jgi:murein DD-endopeptidase MepM/ murein hydrolase activator NlpD
VIGALRIIGMVVGGAMVWVVVASQVPSHLRLPLASVVAGAVITQPFGCTSLELEPYDPFCPGRHVHTGIDLAASMGTAVHWATDGSARVGFDPDGAGNYVVVTVDSHVRVFYCHLSSIGVVNGQAVSAGEVIGALGSSGNSTGPHLHFEIQRDGSSIDPAVWLAS